MEKAVSIDYPVDEKTALGIAAAGRSDTMPGHSYGPAVRPYYLIHFVLAGAGTFHANNVVYHLHAGEGFLIEPNYRTLYQADLQVPWSYVWVGFAGRLASQLVAKLGISEDLPIFKSDRRHEFVDCVQTIMAESRSDVPSRLRQLGALMDFLSYVAEATTIAGRAPVKDYHPVVQSSIDYLNAHSQSVTIDQLAHAVNVDRSYLTDLFKHDLGQAPSEYLRNLRITRARHLLESSSMRINQIADECGYQHANSFARLFRQTYGLSPREYRQQSRGKHLSGTGR